MWNCEVIKVAKGSKLSECDERMLKAIEYLLKGETVSNTAKLIGVDRKTVSDWKTRDFFKAELDRQRTEQKSKIEERILNNVEPLMNKLLDIALKSDSDKTSLDACIYAINRIAGTPTSKIQDVTETDNKDNIDNIETLLEEYDRNVIDLENKRKVN